MCSTRFSIPCRRFAVLALILFATIASAEQPWSQRAADAAIARWPNGHSGPTGSPSRWTYELGTLLEGMDAVWVNTHDPRYLRYIQNTVDGLVAPDGAIPAYRYDEFQLDSILLGRQLLLLANATHDSHYLTAVQLLNDQLQHQPRTPSGGYWHKQRYPNQMWLDGLYMAEPFRAEYAVLMRRPGDFKDITKQFVLMEQRARDPKTGLLYHGWDESKQERWADKQTGLSHEFWARGMGWYVMALVDTLDYYPKNDPGRTQLIAILAREAAAVARYQDTTTGLWYQVVDKAGAKGNYFESSAACMFVYALAKGVHRGYLPAKYFANAERGYHGILARFIQTGPGSDVLLTDTVKSAGLGGNPYRDGSYSYYIGEKTATNDPKGVGAFLLAAAEMEQPRQERK